MNEKQKLFLHFVAGMKSCEQQGIECFVASPETYATADELIVRGWVRETTAEYLDPSTGERSFALTEKGQEETSFIVVTLE
jgi:hypothetical protein